MLKKLSRHGNSHALVIDKPILQVLNITENTQLKIRVENGRIVIEPMAPEVARDALAKVSDDVSFQAAYEKVVGTYDKALKKLAQ